METPFNSADLPIDQLSRLGIYQGDQLLLDSSQVSALLSGRRTSLISLRDIKGDGFEIERLDAKLSLSREENGKVELLIHPIYKQPREHTLLTEMQMRDLITGKQDYISKLIEQEDGHSTLLNVEYDEQTREFISYHVSEIIPPDRVNSILLSEEEKSAFQRGESLELEDGTKLQHRATEPSGLLSNRKMLILSVLIDGGISYLLIKGISAFRQNPQQLDHHTASFERAVQQMRGEGLGNADQRILERQMTPPRQINHR
ncbi:DUF4099 domain-containing protein [Pedobacter rhizosphaerae]|uniref:DUF4099 domain-containing protein n=1 Tax=Pedobacter rhizosphaerae TaxID=390241 RepID=A0A1H9N6C3_9SPHI|nr:DUF4099 domain-containing protein [Pedobacter rhizosphaerae]SER31205.1 Protein of unknown function [Pedobacter rhizosphaerae]